MTADIFGAAVLAAAAFAFVRWRTAVFRKILVAPFSAWSVSLTPGTLAIMAMSSLPIIYAGWRAVFAHEKSRATLRHAWPNVKRSTALFLPAEERGRSAPVSSAAEGSKS